MSAEKESVSINTPGSSSGRAIHILDLDIDGVWESTPFCSFSCWGYGHGYGAGYGGAFTRDDG